MILGDLIDFYKWKTLGLGMSQYEECSVAVSLRASLT